LFYKWIEGVEMTRKKKKRESEKERRRRSALKHQKALEAERLRREREPKKSKGRSRSKVLGVAFLFLIVLVTGVYVTWPKNGAGDNGSSSDIVLLETSMGDITIELYDDMPITTGNFKELIQQGVYDGTIFHRVIVAFMIQGGDPTLTGGSSVPTIPDEFTDHNKNDRGTIAMANAGPNTGSSQFFINLVNNNYLDTEHPVFGKVIDGMDVVDQIAEVETDGEPNNRPLQEVKITKAELIG
jgi:peptidylprolyl isomerase